jgi:hypothetical protein
MLQPTSHSQIEPFDNPEPTAPTAIYFIILLWMFAVLLVFLALFGPPEFWLLAEQIGINDKLAGLGAWLKPLFTANYLSP